jgi:hypothetical protein
MFYGHGVRQLLLVWGMSLLILLGLYRVEVVIPALHDMIVPLYVIVFGVAAFLTLRWLRARSKGDRRESERRKAERRTDPSTGEEI